MEKNLHTLFPVCRETPESCIFRSVRSLSVGRESSLLVTLFLRGLSNPLVPQESSERFSKYLDRSLVFEYRIATTIFRCSADYRLLQHSEKSVWRKKSPYAFSIPLKAAACVFAAQPRHQFLSFFIALSRLWDVRFDIHDSPFV